MKPLAHPLLPKWLMALLVTVVGLVMLQSLAYAGAPLVVLPEPVYEFAPVIEGTYVDHDFSVRNQGDAPLEIVKVQTG
jgi:hypothetical protein